MKLNLPSVQLLCVHGNAINLEDAVASMHLCRNYADFGGSLILSNREPHNLRGEIEWGKEQGDLKWYSQFMVGKVINYITHDHLLVVQHDGMICNPDSWTDDFLQYDYIGAPWPIDRPQPCAVGNGGFSLRSKRLYEELIKIPTVCRENEDAFICIRYRQWLEEVGIRFAPPEVAAQFSLEFQTWHHDDFGKVPFGFHGWYSERDRQFMRMRNQFK